MRIARRQIQPLRAGRRYDVAASPHRNILPKRIGSATKLRKGAMLFSIDGPVTRLSARLLGRGRGNLSSSQKRSSGHWSTWSSSEHCT